MIQRKLNRFGVFGNTLQCGVVVEECEWMWCSTPEPLLNAALQIREEQQDNDVHVGDSDPTLEQSAHNGRLREEGEYVGTEMMYLETRGISRLAALGPR